MSEYDTKLSGPSQAPTLRGALAHHWSAKIQRPWQRTMAKQLILGQIVEKSLNAAFMVVVVGVVALLLVGSFMAYGNSQYQDGFSAARQQSVTTVPSKAGTSPNVPAVNDSTKPSAWQDNAPMVLVREATFWNAYQTNSYDIDQFTMEAAAYDNGFGSYQVSRQLLAAAGVQCGDRIMFRVEDGAVNRLVVEQRTDGTYASCQHGALGYTYFGK